MYHPAMDPSPPDTPPVEDLTKHLREDEAQWMHELGQSKATGLGVRLARTRARLEHVEAVLETNLMHQQGYHRLLSQVMRHHADCPDCARQLELILNMVGHNIEHLDKLMPEREGQPRPVGES